MEFAVSTCCAASFLIVTNYDEYIQKFSFGKRTVGEDCLFCHDLGGKCLVSALETWSEPASSRHAGHFFVLHNTALLCTLDSPPQLPPSITSARSKTSLKGITPISGEFPLLQHA